MTLKLLLILVIFLYSNIAHAQTIPAPANLYMGLIAEDTSGDQQTYLAIASVVRNRLEKGLNHGLVALKRQNLRQFVERECAYALKTKGLDLTKLTTKSLTEVWQGKDYANGATHYEHTGHYPTPTFTKNMKLVKVLYPNTKEEIKFWRQE